MLKSGILEGEKKLQKRGENAILMRIEWRQRLDKCPWVCCVFVLSQKPQEPPPNTVRYAWKERKISITPFPFFAPHFTLLSPKKKNAVLRKSLMLLMYVFNRWLWLKSCKRKKYTVSTTYMMLEEKKKNCIGIVFFLLYLKNIY